MKVVDSTWQSGAAGDDGGGRVRGKGSRPVLPTKQQLIVALCGNGFGGSQRGAVGPLCREAHALVQLHRCSRESPERDDEFGFRRGDIVVGMDRWVAGQGPRPVADAPLHPESVGALINRMAEAAEHAMHILRTEGPNTDNMHAAWTQLAELEVEYADLARELIVGHLRLPPVPRGERTAHGGSAA